MNAGWARGAGLSHRHTLSLTLIIEELFTNTIKHGYSEESNRPVEIMPSLHDGNAQPFCCGRAPRFDPFHAGENARHELSPTSAGGRGPSPDLQERALNHKNLGGVTSSPAQGTKLAQLPGGPESKAEGFLFG